MLKALSNGTIDVALPLFRDYWLAEQKGVIQSKPDGNGFPNRHSQQQQPEQRP